MKNNVDRKISGLEISKLKKNIDAYKLYIIRGLKMNYLWKTQIQFIVEWSDQ